MTKTTTSLPQRAIEAGFTLVELMISVTISLVLVLFVSSLFISSKGSYRLNDDNARLQEDGRYAMALIGRNLMQVGYGKALTRTITDFVNADGKPAQGLMGCDKGFDNPAVATADLVCATAAGKPAFHVSYRVDGAYDANTGSGADCNGQNVVVPPSTPPLAFVKEIVSNRFFLNTKDGVSSLYCNGSGNAVSQPVLSNVEDMVVTYGVNTEDMFTPNQYLNAAAVEALPDPVNEGRTIQKWKQVISVQVCLLLSSANNVTPQAQTYTDCNGVQQTATDRKLRTTMTSVFALRNNATPSLKWK